MSLTQLNNHGVLQKVQKTRHDNEIRTPTRWHHRATFLLVVDPFLEYNSILIYYTYNPKVIALSELRYMTTSMYRSRPAREGILHRARQVTMPSSPLSHVFQIRHRKRICLNVYRSCYPLLDWTSTLDTIKASSEAQPAETPSTPPQVTSILQQNTSSKYVRQTPQNAY